MQASNSKINLRPLFSEISENVAFSLCNGKSVLSYLNLLETKDIRVWQALRGFLSPDMNINKLEQTLHPKICNTVFQL